MEFRQRSWKTIGEKSTSKASSCKFDWERKIIGNRLWNIQIMDGIIKSNCLCKKIFGRKYSTLLAEYMIKCKTFWIKWVQEELFSEKIEIFKNKKIISKSFKLKNIKLQLDEAGIIRINARLKYGDLDFETKCPIILPTDHYITKLIILDGHLRSFHLGVNGTLSTCVVNIGL